MIKVLQGSDAYIPVKKEEATIVLFDGLNKYTSSNVVPMNDGYAVKLTSEETHEYVPR